MINQKTKHTGKKMDIKIEKIDWSKYPNIDKLKEKYFVDNGWKPFNELEAVCCYYNDETLEWEDEIYPLEKYAINQS